MIALFLFINYLIQLYVYIVIASVVLSWLMSFGVVNPYNRVVRSIADALDAVTKPLLRPIRRIMPDLGAIDISPVVLLLACFFIQSVVVCGFLIPAFGGSCYPRAVI